MQSPSVEQITGFLLTRSAHDRASAEGAVTELEYWLKTDQGAVQVLIYQEPCVLFVSADIAVDVGVMIDDQGLDVVLKPLSLRTFEQQEVVGVYASTLKSFYRLRALLDEHRITYYEGDFRPHERYIMERFITGGVEAIGHVVDYGSYRQLSHARLKATTYLPRLSLLSIDLECGKDGQIFSIGLVGEDVAEVLMVGEPEPCEHTKIVWCNSEAALLQKFVERIQAIDPDLLVGWNVVNFDARLLVKRFAYHRMPMAIGRDGSQAQWRESATDRQQGFIDIAGRVVIDGIDALKSGMYQFASFSLEAVAQALLGRGKRVEGDVEDRFAEILYNYQHDKPALAAYNLEDCQLVLDIINETRIIDYLIFRSQTTGLTLDKMGGSVAAFTHLYLPRLHRAGYVAPNLPADGGLINPGGYVMESRPGLYKQILLLDFKSLYPSIIRTFKIDPLGLVEGLRSPEESIEGYLGARFHRTQHFLPDIILSLWQERDEAKANGDAPRSQAIKILMNSFYGVLGSGGCRFYDTRLASSITLRGHDIMKQTKRWIEAEGYEVIYGDTDSTFVWIKEPVSDERAVDIGQFLMHRLNRKWQLYIRDNYDLESDLEIEFETYFSRFLMPTIRGTEAGSKKRYAGLICDQGAGQPASERLVFKGLESVRSDWTPLAKAFQQRLYELVFTDQDPADYIIDVVRATRAGELDAQLVYQKRIRRPLREYVKNIPPQIRAAKAADEQNRLLGRPLQYQNKGKIQYLITTQGPQAVDYLDAPLDYSHYITKQLKPVADSILPFVGLDFDQLTDMQQRLI